jgi:hypothetical protein
VKALGLALLALSKPLRSSGYASNRRLFAGSDSMSAADVGGTVHAIRGHVNFTRIGGGSRPTRTLPTLESRKSSEPTPR